MVKLYKERDFHKMHHKRVAQEKNKLINDLKKEVTGLQATLRNLESGHKVEVSLKKEESKNKKEMGPTQKAIKEAREKELLQEGVAPYSPEKDPNKQIGKRHPKVGNFIY
ncbi:hypothetical protein XELAEV_18044860mg [Xenopus laevis]|uniref:Uncharacterized protein n=1 Tax=Xenopus laevis TaxID=8355 RepID=A0A974BZG8_XENLA|nr:hypothetical protein XELAEV_18044860mg [Xenopus laevis]